MDFFRLRQFWSNLDYLSKVLPLAEQDIQKEDEERRRQEVEERKRQEERKKKEEQQKAKQTTTNSSGVNNWQPRSYSQDRSGGGYISYAANYCHGWCGEMARAAEESNR